MDAEAVCDVTRFFDDRMSLAFTGSGHTSRSAAEASGGRRVHEKVLGDRGDAFIHQPSRDVDAVT